MSTTAACSAARRCMSSLLLSHVRLVRPSCVRAAVSNPTRPHLRLAHSSGHNWPPRQQDNEDVNPLTLHNAAIPFRMVQLVDPETDTLLPLASLHSILRTVNTRTHVVKLVQVEPPIVKIVDLEEQRLKDLDHEAKVRFARRVALEDKEIQVGWHVAAGDIAHKIATARSLLAKGDRVHLVFAKRAGSNVQTTTDERKADIVSQFDEALSSVARRWREDDISKGLWICYWHPLPSITAGARQKIADSDANKKRIRDEKKEARRLKEEERLRRSRERASKP